jgi:hypothetical protein
MGPRDPEDGIHAMDSKGTDDCLAATYREHPSLADDTWAGEDCFSPTRENLTAAASHLLAGLCPRLGLERPVDGDAYESGVLLPGPRARLGGPTFEEWLDEVGR